MDDGNDDSKQVFLDSIVHPQFDANALSSNDDTITTPSATVVTPPSRVDWGILENMKNKGCCTATLGELRQELANGRDPLERFHTFLWSPIFPEFTNACGIELDRYELPITWVTNQEKNSNNENKTKTNSNATSMKGEGSGGCDTVNRRFEDLLNDKTLDDSRKLAMVFHGSYTTNITNILENGLDPGRRRGQALGQGEYFAIDPAICINYCKRGKEMVVFLVLVPEKNQGQQHSPTTGWAMRCIVVKETKHQFPIGVLKFKSFTAEAQSQSDMMRHKIQSAQKELEKQEDETKNAQMKAYIIQLLIQNKIDLAASKYEKVMEKLSEAYKREISIYVHECMDADVVPCLFPDLPPPFSVSEFQEVTSGANAAIQQVECHVQKTQKAKAKLNETQAEFTELREQRNKKLKGAVSSLPQILPHHPIANHLGGGSSSYETKAVTLASLPESMKSSRDAMAVASLSGKFLDGNALFGKISRLNQKELRYKTIYNLTNNMDLDVISEILSAPVNNNTTSSGGGNDPTTKDDTFWVLRGKFEHRSDVGMLVTLIKENNISKCFAVKLIQNPTDQSSCVVPATLEPPSQTISLLNPFGRRKNPKRNKSLVQK